MPRLEASGASATSHRDGGSSSKCGALMGSAKIGSRISGAKARGIVDCGGTLKQGESDETQKKSKVSKRVFGRTERPHQSVHDSRAKIERDSQLELQNDEVGFIYLFSCIVLTPSFIFSSRPAFRSMRIEQPSPKLCPLTR